VGAPAGSCYNSGVGYRIRESMPRSVGTALWLLVTLAVPVVIIWAFTRTYGDLRHSTPLRWWAIGMIVAMSLLAALLSYALVATVVRAVRRTVVVAVDGRGITLGREGLAGRAMFAAWPSVARVRTYTICWRGTTGEDPPLEYAHYLRVDLRDGTGQRRLAPVGRRDFGDLAGAVGRYAPRVPVLAEGLYPEGEDPG
jgi:hypothetical protein